MKNKIRQLASLFWLLLAATPLVLGAAEKTAPKEVKGEMRVLAGPDRERRGFGPREAGNIEKETVAFLGVEAGPVSATISAQLSLLRGTGLVVNHVVPASPASGVLNEHDILLKLDDQILIETRQLAVLIRNHQEGDEVTLTYMRGGQQHTAKIKLSRHEVPKFSAMAGPGAPPFGIGPGGERADVDRVLSLLRRPPGAPEDQKGPTPPPAMRMQIERRGSPGFRTMSVNAGNSSLVFSDDEGSLELSIKDGAKTLVAKNAKGEQLFSGPVTTPEERKAVPERVRVRLEKLEGMHDVTFRTDADFKGAENRVIRPRGIALPLPHGEARPVPPPGVL